MASRSFKPSYLASAAHPPTRSARPSFARTNSSSSTRSNISTQSDDSLASALYGLNTADAGSERATGTAISASNAPPTPGRKKSKPIAIELPSKRTQRVYTPLTARGDLIGGYFPNHEDPTTVTRPYQPHPFHHSFSRSVAPDSPIMSASSSLHPSPSNMPLMSGHVYTPIGGGPLSPNIPDSLMIPMGKYHPSNYKSPASTQVSTPNATPRPSFMSPANLSLPPVTKRGGNRPGHERKSSDVKRKLQQYQQNMIAQAKAAASRPSVKMVVKPDSPRLLPAGSPGPITPFELEGESDGYIVAGHQVRRASLITDALQQEQGRGVDDMRRI